MHKMQRMPCACNVEDGRWHSSIKPINAAPCLHAHWRAPSALPLWLLLPTERASQSEPAASEAFAAHRACLSIRACCPCGLMLPAGTWRRCGLCCSAGRALWQSSCATTSPSHKLWRTCSRSHSWWVGAPSGICHRCRLCRLLPHASSLGGRALSYRLQLKGHRLGECVRAPHLASVGISGGLVKCPKPGVAALGLLLNSRTSLPARAAPCHTSQCLCTPCRASRPRGLITGPGTKAEAAHLCMCAWPAVPVVPKHPLASLAPALVCFSGFGWQAW